MLSISEIKIGRVVVINGEPYIVLKTDHHKMGRGGAVLKVKLKNLINSGVLDKTFQGNEKAEEAGIEKKKASFMYKDEESANFMDSDTYEQFAIPLEAIGAKQKFLCEGADVDVLCFNNKAVAVDLPVKMKFKVVEAPPGIKGNSAGNVTKKIKIETGAEINTPLFINEGDEIMVNTEKEEYVERA